jgi:DNA-binding transcriptional ArsR family regulator
MAEASIARAAALAKHLADPVRLGVLDLLAAEGSMTVSELAAQLAVRMPALSNHLAKLRADELVSTERGGRQTYYSLTDPGLKDLLDTLRRTAGTDGAADLAPADSAMSLLREARTCYDHLAGRFGVDLFDVLIGNGVIEHANDRPGSIRDGAAGRWFHRRLELDTAALHASRRRYAFGCLDWTERRVHLGGALAAAIADRLFDRAWVERVPGSRAVRVTSRGRTGMTALAAALARR